MDYEEDIIRRNQKDIHSAVALRRLTLLALCSLFSFFLLSFLIDIVLVSLPELPISSPTLVLSKCKIVSSTVDLKSSKVCGIGLLDYKANHVYYPFESNKFRCRYDYYWASIFKVEYRHHSLGRTQLAFAEAPTEALPLDCRPNFSGAWFTKDKFKVNETYDCWYTSDVAKIKLYPNGFFGCQGGDPSTLEMITKYTIVFTRFLRSTITRQGFKYSSWGAVAGFSTSLITIIAIRIVQQIKSRFLQASPAKILVQVVNSVHFRRACFLLAYLSIMGWLATQYWKLLHLPNIFII